MTDWLSWHRLWGVVVKEFVQLRRDRLTFAMILSIPLVQLTLFGYAINSDPRHLPTVVFSKDNSAFSRAIVSAMQSSTYFRVVAMAQDAASVDTMLARGEVQFAVEIPVNFSRDLMRGDQPSLLMVADATDPAATGTALNALDKIVDSALRPLLDGALLSLAQPAPAVDVRIQRRYNPESLTQYNIVPGLMGTILTMTMIIMTSLAMTRERERGTLETLLATPVRPLEVMVGKLLPFILIGALQVLLILSASHILFHVPMEGAFSTLSAGLSVFVIANLAVGFLFSTIARNQMQAMQMSFFFFLPSILMSGFMFPFRGMPDWAQIIGNILPLTHILRIVRGVMLKGIGMAEVWSDLMPIIVFMGVVSSVAVLRYKQTLE